MARQSPDRKRIKQRREQIAALMADHETKLEQLRSEDLDLAIAERVLDRLLTEPETVNERTIADPAPDKQQADITIGDMAVILLREAGDAGLHSNEILAAVRERWLPTLMRTSLSPPLSRLKAKGTIEQVDDRWRLVAENAPPNGSEPGGAEIGKGEALAQPDPTYGAAPNGQGTG